VDFINEENVLAMEIGQDSRQVSGALYCRPRGNPDTDTHLDSDYVGQGGLTQTGGAIEQYMVQWLTPALGGGDSYSQVFFNPGLPDKVIKAPGSQAQIKRYVLGTGST
jgi:hypothetical protein